MVEIMVKEERRVAHLIDDLLDLGRIRSGQLEMELSSVDLCDVVRDVSAQMQVQVAGASKLNVELHGPVMGCWDRSRLNQVVTNLVGNAVKYGQGRPVVIRAAADSQRESARLEVIDSGLGIPPNFTLESSSRSNALSQRVNRTGWVSGCTSCAASFSNSAGR